MGINEIYNSTFKVLEKNLDLRLQRHNLLSSNIANMDTPNYRPFDMVIEEAFEKSNESEKLQLNNSNAMHLKNAHADGKDSYGLTNGLLKEEEKVDLDKSMSNLSENTLLYNASVQILSKKYQMIKQSISGGTR